MQHHRFDQLTKLFRYAQTRRGLLALLALAEGPPAFPFTASAAKKGKGKKRKGKKGKGKKRCRKPCGACRRCRNGRCRPVADGTSCGAYHICQSGGCTQLSCGAGGPCRVFLSSVAYSGNLGGLGGADAKCQGLAAAAHLPGIYKAWLADATSAPSARFTPSSGPYQLINGVTVAANWADLTDGTLAALINVTETGGTANGFAWTHTNADGTAGGFMDIHCANWSTANGMVGGDVGFPGSITIWTESGWTACSNLRHLYCFQQS